MLERLVKAGAPSFFPYVGTISGGTGGLCSKGVIDGFLKGHHKYLPYVANGINWVTMEGQDVISAHFSGCIMATFKDGGIVKVCHVSTGAEFGDCKAAWDGLKANFTNVFEFRPSDFIENTPHERCYGLITADLQMYTILVGAKSVVLGTGKDKKNLRADPKFLKITKARLLR